MARWVTIGTLDITMVACSGFLAVATAAALWAWAVYVAKGLFGPFEAYLSWLTLPMVPLFAVCNAIGEEVEYRGIMMAALFAGDTSSFSQSWESILQVRPLCLIALQAALFAMEHYHTGFPSGKIGFGMVFVWGSLLGVLRLFTNGMLLPVAVHVVADTVIGVILVSRQRKTPKRLKRVRKKAPTNQPS